MDVNTVRLATLVLIVVGVSPGCSDDHSSAEGAGTGGDSSELADHRRAGEVCTSTSTREECLAVKFDLSGCDDCSASCIWGTVRELNERHGWQLVFGLDGPVGQVGGAGGETADVPGCYVLGSEGG